MKWSMISSIAFSLKGNKDNAYFNTFKEGKSNKRMHEWSKTLTSNIDEIIAKSTYSTSHSLKRDDLAAHLEIDKCFKISPLFKTIFALSFENYVK